MAIQGRNLCGYVRTYTPAIISGSLSASDFGSEEWDSSPRDPAFDGDAELEQVLTGWNLTKSQSMCDLPLERSLQGSLSTSVGFVREVPLQQPFPSNLGRLNAFSWDLRLTVATGGISQSLPIW